MENTAAFLHGSIALTHKSQMKRTIQGACNFVSRSAEELVLPTLHISHTVRRPIVIVVT